MKVTSINYYCVVYCHNIVAVIVAWFYGICLRGEMCQFMFLYYYVSLTWPNAGQMHAQKCLVIVTILTNSRSMLYNHKCFSLHRLCNTAVHAIAQGALPTRVDSCSVKGPAS